MAEIVTDAYLPPAPPPRRRTPLIAGVAIAAVAALVASGVGLAALAAQDSPPASSPEATVRAVLDATQRGDVTAVLANVDPSESGALRSSADSVLGAVKQLGLLDQSASLSQVSGATITFDGQKMTTEYLDQLEGPNKVAAVTFTAGTARVKVDPSALPLGSLAKGLVGQGTNPVDRTIQLAGTDAAKRPIVTVNRNGTWYVSLSYTAAEILRRKAGIALPAAPATAAAVGATSPDAVVQDLLDATAKGDTAKVTGLIAPDEAGALRAYLPLLGQLDAGKTPAASISRVKLADAPVSEGTLVTVTSLHVTLGNGATADLAPGGCLTITDPGHQTPDLCNGPLTGLLSGGKVGFVTVNKGGQWYLSPSATLTHDVSAAVSGLNLGDLAKGLGGLPGLKDLLPGAGTSKPGAATPGSG